MNDELGFVLHSHPYKETSLIVELFLRERGRVSVVAKGARWPAGCFPGCGSGAGSTTATC